MRDLEKKGLVARRGDEADSRKTRALLTAEGRALLDQIRPIARWHETRVLRGIDEADLKGDLDRLLTNAEDILKTAEDPAARR